MELERPPTAGTPRRVALVHDFLLDVRGAERVFEVMCDTWPEADVFTAVYDRKGTEGRFEHREVHTSPLQVLRPTARSFRALLPLYPWAIGTLDLDDYDLVVSSSSAWAHGIRPADGAVHVCYCHNPFRYAWAEREATLEARGPLMRPVLAKVFERWREWDAAVARNVDAYIANSAFTADRIDRYLDRESTVIHPPVDVRRFSVGEPGDYHLAVGELMPHKRFDVIVEAFNRLGRRLIIAGDGPQRRRLDALAGPTVELVGRVSDAHMEELMRGCQALVTCAVEEFGIAVVETLASGRPVIAIAAGGVLETVTEGETGTFFTRPEPDAIAAAVQGFDALAVDPRRCREDAEAFDVEHFSARLRGAVDAALRGDRVMRS